jgi:hypothetical protein
MVQIPTQLKRKQNISRIRRRINIQENGTNAPHSQEHFDSEISSLVARAVERMLERGELHIENGKVVKT